MSLQELIEEARRKAEERIKNLRYDDELVKYRLKKHYGLLKLAIDAVRRYKKNSTYFEIDFSHPSYFVIWLVKAHEEKREKIFRLPYSYKTTYTLIATLYTYSKMDDWVNFDELKFQTEEENKKVKRRDVNLLSRTKYFKKLFETDGNKVKLRHPLGDVKII